jgi:hypothetical protein
MQMTNPFTPQEDEIMNHLADAWNDFIKLEITHPDEKRDFANAIHTLQQIMVMRIVRRDYPMTFPSYNKEGVNKMSTIELKDGKITIKKVNFDVEIDNVVKRIKENIKLLRRKE